MSASIINKRFYKLVSEGSVEEDILAVASGKDLYVKDIGGSSVYSNDVKVELVWGNEIVFATHGDSYQIVDKHFIGDGTKTMKIRLVNDSSIAETIGLYYNGDLT